jgi:hypothetical protein
LIGQQAPATASRLLQALQWRCKAAACGPRERRTERQLRNKTGRIRTGKGDDGTVRAQQCRLVHGGLFTQAIQRRELARRCAFGQDQRHRFALASQILQHVVQIGASKAQAAFKRLFHAHVEPGFDGSRKELHRYGVNKRARQHRHQCEQQYQPQRQLGTEYARVEASAQQQQLVADHQHQNQDDADSEREQQWQIAGKPRRVGAGAGAADRA